ncbi:Lrp/AsnC family transcriptional regulator [Humidisolicoccus flavus]|uniref:Lrp/AsnC family transcriptional regulator n=1 Tax=Humidisolicoccus flavus TaxID=3111414 RepID=UPI003249843C
MDEDRSGIPAPSPASNAGTVNWLGSTREIDEIDRRIIVALQQDGRASWTAIAEFAGAPASTVSRRGQQLISDGIVRVGMVPTLGSEGHAESFLIRINCAPGTQMYVAEKLVESPYVRFVTLVTGKFDIFAEVVISGDSGVYAHVLTELQSIEGVAQWSSDLLLHTYKVSFDWGRQVYDAEARPDHPEAYMPAPNTCEPAHFDDTDREIVRELSADGRKSFQAIAKTLGVNESSVRRRYERMHSSGCLTTVTMVPASALGMSAETLLVLNIDPARLRDVSERLAALVSVRFLAAPLDNNSLYCEVILPSTESLHEFMIDTIAQIEGVRGWTASMELVFMKRGFIETPWWKSQVLGTAANA